MSAISNLMGSVASSFRVPGGGGGGGGLPTVTGLIGANPLVTMPTHAAGDILVIFADRLSNNNAPSVPAGWTQLSPSGLVGGSTSSGAVIGYKIAASSSETSGTWTSATQLQCMVISGADIAIGADSNCTFIGGTSVVPATGFTLDDISGNSIILWFWRSQTNGVYTNVPTGFTLVDGGTGSTGAYAMAYSGPLSSFSTLNAALSGSTAIMSATIELKTNKPLVTLNPADTSSLITLSNGNLRATKNAATSWVSARSTQFISTGKKYFETKFVAFPGSYIAGGFANASAVLNNYIGSNLNSLGIINTGQYFVNAAASNAIASLVAGDTVCFAIDFTLGKWWARKNNLAWFTAIAGTQNPVTNQGGLALPTNLLAGFYPSVSVQNASAGDTMDCAFTHGFAYSPPDGFVGC